MKPIILHRQREYEMKQAIKDLTDRGFKVVYGPIERTWDGKSFNTDDYGRQIFSHNTYSSIWVAKLVREEAQ